MGHNSSIEWTGHTFNPWWGCTKRSPACTNCYALSIAKRYGHNVWGKETERRFFGDSHWKEPLKWNAEAQRRGVRARVFCASMADVFEDHPDLEHHRRRLWELIVMTPWLDWLLLTKRPENIDIMSPWKKDRWPHNVWLGTTVESQEYVDQRLPHLLKHDAAVRFVSCEPLLGPVNLTPWFKHSKFKPLDWVIVGGESGPGARPMPVSWPESLLNQCREGNVAFFFKQWGNWSPPTTEREILKSKIVEAGGAAEKMVRKTKAASGRLLRGRTWDELPSSLKLNGMMERSAA